MLVLILGMVIHHRREEAKNRQLLPAGSFMGAGATASKTHTLKSRFNKLNSIRKSKISSPMQDIGFSSGHAREVSEGSDKFGLSSWNSHDRLRHGKQTSISSGREGRRQGNQMTLGEALKHDRAFPLPPAPPQ